MSFYRLLFFLNVWSIIGLILVSLTISFSFFKSILTKIDEMLFSEIFIFLQTLPTFNNIYSLLETYYDLIFLMLSKILNINYNLFYNFIFIYRDFGLWILLFFILFLFLHYVQNKLIFYLYKKFSNIKIMIFEIIETTIVTILLFFLKIQFIPLYIFLGLIFILRWIMFVMYKRLI